MRFNELKNTVNSMEQRLNKFMNYKAGDEVQISFKTDTGWNIEKAAVVAVNMEVGVVVVQSNYDNAIRIIIDDECIRYISGE